MTAVTIRNRYINRIFTERIHSRPTQNNAINTATVNRSQTESTPAKEVAAA